MRLSGGLRAGCRVHPGVRSDKLNGRNSAWKERLSLQVRAKVRGQGERVPGTGTAVAGQLLRSKSPGRALSTPGFYRAF